VFVLGFGGYAQRVAMALLSSWQIVIALHLTRLPRSSNVDCQGLSRSV
jgi:hypothetical protein